MAYPRVQVQFRRAGEVYWFVRTSFKSDAALYMRGTGVEHTIYYAYKGMRKNSLVQPFVLDQ